MLLIWCKEPKHRVMNAIAPVLNASPDLHVEVCNVFSHLPDRPELGAVLCMGSGPLEHLAALKAIPRNRTISSLRNRGHIVEGLSAPAIFTYSSGIGDIDYGKFVDLQTDVALAIRLAKTGSLEPQMGTYRYVHYFTDLLAQVDAQYAATGKPVDLGFDLETIGFDPYRLPSEGHPGAYIVTMQASVKAGTGDVIYFNSREELQARVKEDKQFMEEIVQLMTSPKISIRGANLKFDLHWLHVWLAIDCTNFKFDTTMVGSILDENRSNALNVHAKVYTGMGGYDDRFNDSIDKSRMDLVPKDSLLPYAAGDADATLQVADAQKKLLLQDKSLARFYVNILHPAVRAMETVEQGGVCVDMKAYEELEQELNVEIDSLILKAQTIMGGRIVAKHQDLSKRGGINLTKASLLNDFMFSPMGLNLRPRMMTPKGDKPATSMEHLLMFDDVPEAQDFVGILKDFSSATKTMGTYVTGFKSHIRSDGRFHPTYYLFAGNRDTGEGGTVTGRLSCKDPAFQCLRGDTLVLTDRGEIPIQQIVEGYEKGESYKVLTHTGKWRNVIGVYRNGVQPVNEVEFASGKIVPSTDNHPYLTDRGWVRTDQLLEGDTGYELRAQNAALHQSDLSQLDCNEEPLHLGDQQGLGELRGAGDNRLRKVDGLQKLSGRHGGEAQSGNVYRETGCERELRAGELHLGYPLHSDEEQEKQSSLDSQGRDQNIGGVGNPCGDKSGTIALSAIRGDVDGGSNDEGDPWNRAFFQPTEVVQVTRVGDFETFDLTIEGSHSFVANGVIVHNTIPKHTKWAKKLRKCFVAPEGMLVMENDYSQGELRVIACVANEPTMIQAYRDGLDLHVITPSQFMGFTVEEILAMEESDPDQFGHIRQMGKAGNFGLIYGMSAGGFQSYASANYGVKMTSQEADAFRNGFFNTYQALPEYHAEFKAHAKRFGHVRSPLGRVRNLPLINSPNREVRSSAERMAINSPIQSTLSDMMIWAVALAKERNWHKETPCFGLVHDAGYRYIPEDNFEYYARREVDLMENLPFERVGWNPQLTFTADCKVGKNMGEMNKVTF